MSDFQKPPPTQETHAYPTVYATPVQTVVYQGVMVGAWSVDFWGCCDILIPNCCMVTFCPCVSLAQISARLGVAPYRRVLVIFLLLTLAEVIAGLNPVQSWTITIVRAIFFAYIWHLRQTTRRLFQIPGGPCGDCWSSFCCSCCTMAQIATHIKSYKPGDCSFGPLDVLPPYTGQTTS
ncbi:PLAC8 family protein [Phytophthora infestans T30-4]|uniref:PLAC8 family protein n=1 Tax=Phytophthora infestans (strain T30-4) TaxID=403677 RepID=D0NA53_PHYIT|nr:PLAC8 family protein [Phytophthora infestans T30-4]EEY54307.1 PLAC8 family protein [Phytophthora infestans T30-4]|eukprot:XP_002904129.1 PLAC8 family protein [Phytophthora infestans T30-4]